MKEKKPFIKHVAGSYDDETKMQLCKICGCVITDNNGVMCPGGGIPLAWEEDKFIYISHSGSFRTTVVMPGTKVISCIAKQFYEKEGIL